MDISSKIAQILQISPKITTKSKPLWKLSLCVLKDDIDIMGINGDKGIFCEYKFKNEKFDLSEFDDLISASEIFTDVKEKYYYVFVKSEYTQAVIDKSKEYNIRLLTIDDLFKID